MKSPVINIIISACFEAARNLKRDFKEIIHLKAEKNVDNYIEKSYTNTFKNMREILERTNTAHGFELGSIVQKESKSGFTWVVDPIDCKENFAHNMPFWGTLIILRKNETNTAVAAGLYLPMQDEFFGVQKDEGVYLNDRRQRAKPYHKFNLTTKNRKIGGSALHCAYFAANRLNAIFEYDMNEHTKLFCKLIVQEAEAEFVEENGCFAASNRNLVEELKNHI